MANTDLPNVFDEGRLNALIESGLMDSEAEEAFDRLTRLTARLLDVPVALVSLVDNERQFFKSQQGLPEPWASERQTPLSHSFCKHVVDTGEPLIVRDSREHELVRDNRAVEDLNVVAYAGVPIETSSGYVLGSFCAIDSEPRTWSEDELSVLSDLADAAMTEIELRAAVRQAEEESRERAEAEARLNDVLDHSSELIQSTDADGKLTYVNQAWTRVLGYSKDEADGMPVWDIVHPDSVEHCSRIFGRVLTGETVRDFQAVLRSKEGRAVPVKGFTSCRMENGSPVATRTFFRDITKRTEAERALRESEAHYRQLVENASDLIYTTGEDGKFSYANPTALETVGYNLEELKEMHFLELVHPDHRDEVSNFYVEQVRSGAATAYYECPVVTRWGDTVWIGQHVRFEISDGWVRKTHAVARNITRRKELDRMKAEFVSVVSHELRTPLTSIRGALGLLAGGALGTLPEKGQRMIEVASTNADRLVRLINDILDLERLESGRTELEPKVLDATDLIDQTIELMAPMAGEHGVRLSSDLPAGDGVMVRVDGDRILQTLSNLVSNAIKFSPKGSDVTVRARPVDDSAVFTVEDQGRGVPPHLRERVFDRFQQVDASDSREKGGTGLGLAICKTIVESHGGRIWIEGREGGGAIFNFSVPLAEPGKAAGDTGADDDGGDMIPEIPRGARNILVCEDDDWLREVVCEILELRGNTVFGAADGPEALELARTASPDLILLDLGMPGMTGWETLQCLTEDEAVRGIPVIIFSGAPPEPGADLPEGAVDWLVKPVSGGVIADAVERALAAPDATGGVLVVEDDDDLARVLMAVLEERGLDAVRAATAQEAIRLAQEVSPAILTLDLHLPDTDGVHVLRWLRQHQTLKEVPVLVYSARLLSKEDRAALAVPEDRIAEKSKVSVHELAERIGSLLASRHKDAQQGGAQ